MVWQIEKNGMSATVRFKRNDYGKAEVENGLIKVKDNLFMRLTELPIVSMKKQVD